MRISGNFYKIREEYESSYMLSNEIGVMQLANLKAKENGDSKITDIDTAVEYLDNNGYVIEEILIDSIDIDRDFIVVNI